MIASIVTGLFGLLIAHRVNDSKDPVHKKLEIMIIGFVSGFFVGAYLGFFTGMLFPVYKYTEIYPIVAESNPPTYRVTNPDGSFRDYEIDTSRTGPISNDADSKVEIYIISEQPSPTWLKYVFFMPMLKTYYKVNYYN